MAREKRRSPSHYIASIMLEENVGPSWWPIANEFRRGLYREGRRVSTRIDRVFRPLYLTDVGWSVKPSTVPRGQLAAMLDHFVDDVAKAGYRIRIFIRPAPRPRKPATKCAPQRRRRRRFLRNPG